MPGNKFDSPQSHEVTILDSKSQVVGHIRIKPNKILWSPKNSKKWHGASINLFSEWIKKEGTIQSR
jgi:hypothetical protein